MKALPQSLSVAILPISLLALCACNGSGAPPSTFTIGGTVVNLAGTGGGLVLQNNLKDTMSVNANGRFTFANPVASESSYSITISAQPSAPAQICGVVNGSGIATADITNVEVNCGHNEWAWAKGSASANAAGVYGTQGTPGANNTPGARQFPVTWTDASGNFSLFGGQAIVNNTYVLANDLWEFKAGQWTWVGGSSVGNAAGVYGTLGVPAPENFPGGRKEAMSWTDKSGNFWLFGGLGYDSAGNVGQLNDLWKYSDGQWTWMNGPNITGLAGVYGTMGVPSPDNFPGARLGGATWTDSSGDLWLFGGLGGVANEMNTGYNDLWRFSDGEWTWMGGTNAKDQDGVYGTKGVASPENVPGARFWSVAWTDTSGNFWLFGGDSDVHGWLNDLWEYSDGEWTWMAGSNLPMQPGIYGTRGAPAAANTPGSRQMAIGWTDASGNLWLFGGNGADSQGNPGLLNDLWEFTDGKWTWISGSSAVNQAGVYGSQGTPFPGNVPGARAEMGPWVDLNGNLWLFGGFGVPASGSEGNLNDLWMYMP